MQKGQAMLKTPLTQDWGLRHPILNASMTPAAGGALARAVSDAGGLGMIGVNETWTAADIELHCRIARADDPRRKFGIGFFGWGLEREPRLLDAAIEQCPFLISISFVDPAPYVAKVHANGILVATQVQSRADAELALRAGADVLIAQGTEAGGHTGDVSTLLILQIVLGLTSKPVLAAGGVATPAGLAAVLAAGAAGAWVGTPFLLAVEADVSDAARARIGAADETQTILTGLFDRVQNFPWPKRFRGRALRNEFTARWQGHEAELLADPAALEEFRQAKRTGNFDIANIYVGQSAGLVSGTVSAAQIVRGLGEGAERLLRRRLGELLN
jgi:nitronate monooxygenase